MKVSIAMATYNGAQYILDQLQSFTDQTRQPDELIITDDCSTDETETIVKEFAKTAPFTVNFHRNEKNLGYSGNFNAALMKTTGDLVFLSDQDDVWFSEKIAYMLGVAENNPQALVVMNDALLTDGELNEVGLTKMGQIRSAGLSMDAFVMGCCCGIRRELLDLCMPIPAIFKGHDNWLVWFAEGLNAKKVEDKVLQYYRRHESNESQFIANRTTKVSRIEMLFHSLNKALHKDSENNERAQLEQFLIFADGVRLVRDESPEGYQTQLIELENKFREILKNGEKRSAVRSRPFVARIFAASNLLMNGGYPSNRALKAFFRDLLG